MKKESKTLREFGKIWRRADFESSEIEGTLDHLYLSDLDFENVRSFIEENKETTVERAFQIRWKKGKIYISVKNYVGLIETKNGTIIEILPKIFGLPVLEEINLLKYKRQFLKMLSCLKSTPFISIKEAHLKTVHFTILEIFITAFVSEMQDLLKVGLQKKYMLIEGNQRFLKGKLLFQEQQKRNIIQAHNFYSQSDEYLVNTAPNRLIKTCLKLLLSNAQSIANQNQIRHQLLHFDQVPTTRNISRDFQKSKISSRLDQHYQKTLEWAKIFLEGKSFTNFKGHSLNQALLFPMERIFENYIGTQIKKYLTEYEVKLQDRQFHLINEHLGKPKFRLQPDIVLTKADKIIIIDAKWKVINQGRPKSNYEITQSDIYQLFGYGEKYRQHGHSPILILLYPLQEQFTDPLPVFYYYEERLPLYVLPFDLMNQDVCGEILKILDRIDNKQIVN